MENPLVAISKAQKPETEENPLVAISKAQESSEGIEQGANNKYVLTSGHTTVYRPEDGAIWIGEDAIKAEPWLQKRGVKPGWYHEGGRNTTGDRGFIDPNKKAYNTPGGPSWWKKAANISPVGQIIAAAADDDARQWQKKQITGFAKGVSEGLIGIGKFGRKAAEATGIISPETSKDWAKNTQDLREGFNKQTGYTPGEAPVAEFVGEMAPGFLPGLGGAGLVGKIPAVAKVASKFPLASKIIGGTVGGIGQGLTSSTANDLEGDEYWRQKAIDTTLGAGLGAGLGTATGLIKAPDLSKLRKATNYTKDKSAEKVAKEARKSLVSRIKSLDNEMEALIKEDSGLDKAIADLNNKKTSRDTILSTLDGMSREQKMGFKKLLDENPRLLGGREKYLYEAIEQSIDKSKRPGPETRLINKQSKELERIFSDLHAANELPASMEGIPEDVAASIKANKLSEAVDLSKVRPSLTQLFPNSHLLDLAEKAAPMTSEGTYKAQQKYLSDLVDTQALGKTQPVGQFFRAARRKADMVESSIADKYKAIQSRLPDIQEVRTGVKDHLKRTMNDIAEDLEVNPGLKALIKKEAKAVDHIRTAGGLDDFRKHIGKMIGAAEGSDDLKRRVLGEIYGHINEAYEKSFKRTWDVLEGDKLVKKNNFSDVEESIKLRKQLQRDWKGELLEGTREFSDFIPEKAEDAEKVIGRLIKEIRNNPKGADKLIETVLDEDGKLAVKRYLLEDIAKSAKSLKTERLSGSKLMKAIEDNLEVFEKVSTPEELANIETLRDAANYFSKSATFDSIPDNGVKAGIWAGLIAAVSKGIWALTGLVFHGAAHTVSVNKAIVKALEKIEKDPQLPAKVSSLIRNVIKTTYAKVAKDKPVAIDKSTEDNNAKMLEAIDNLGKE